MSQGAPIDDHHDLATRVRNGERRALAMALTLCERPAPAARALMAPLLDHLTGVGVIGVTGPPGSGKSTLVNALARTRRSIDPDTRVAILAIDPSSPVSGGSILGDRVRMTVAGDDTGIYVRSLSASGHLGGMTPAIARMIDVFDAAGYGCVIIETVGTGQSEVDVAEVADVKLVVAAPGLGDDIQAMKSGLLEIADVIAVNKADRPGAEQTRQHLAGAMSLRVGAIAPVLCVSAQLDQGIDALNSALTSALGRALHRPVSERRRDRARYLLHRASTRLIHDLIRNGAAGMDGANADAIAMDLLNGDCDTVEALRRLLPADYGRDGR